MRFSFMAVILASIMVLAACQTDDTGMNNNDGQSDYQQTRYNNDGGGQGFVGDNENRQGAGNRQGNDNQQQNRGTGIGNQDRNDENNFDMAEDIAERVANNVDEVDRANVMTGDNNAYVAVVLNNDNNNRNAGNNNGNEQNDVSDDVEDQITDVVQSSKSSIENVYVSTNPDFVGTLEDYADRVADGDPIEGLFEETNEMIQRIFPNLNQNN